MRRNATLFVLISLLSGFGSTMLTLSAGVWVLDLTGSVALGGLVGACLYLPTYISPWLGVLVDRLPRRPLVIGVDMVLGLLMLTLLTVDTRAGLWLIVAVLLARGVAYSLGDAGESALLPAALPAESLGRVNGWRSSAQEGMKLLGPLGGAALYAWRGPHVVVLISAATPMLAAACYALLRIDRIHTRARHVDAAIKSTQVNTSTDIDSSTHGSTHVASTRGLGSSQGGAWAGVVTLFKLPAVRVPVLIAAAAIGTSGLTGTAVLGLVVHERHLPGSYLGYVTSAQGAGSIVGGLVVGLLIERLGATRVAVLGTILYAMSRLVMCLPSWPAMLAGGFLGGVGLPWPLIAGMTAIQTDTPEHLLGRVSATSNTVMFGPTALAMPIGAAFVLLGDVPPMVTAALVCLVAAGAGLTAYRKRARHAESVTGPRSLV